MISAKQALELYNQSGREVEEFLKRQVEPYVAAAASAGVRQTFIHLGTVGPVEYVQDKTLPLHRAVAAKLKELHYRVSIERYGESYVPRGLANDFGEGPLHTNFGFKINW